MLYRIAARAGQRSAEHGFVIAGGWHVGNSLLDSREATKVWPMTRFAIACVMLAGGTMMVMEPAHSQGVQYQFTPPPPIKSLPSSSAPSYPPIPDVAPPAPAPSQSHLAPYRVTPPPRPSESRSARTVQTSRGRTIVVPSSPGETFGDRVSNCAHAGASAGLGPNRLSAFMGRCTN
jgi:hypothetical protein